MTDQHPREDAPHTRPDAAPVTPSETHSWIGDPAFWTAAGALLVGVALLVLVAFWDRLVQALVPEASSLLLMGQVQRVRYIGAPGPMTQVDVANESLLLWGAVRLPLGTPLYLRSDASGKWICDAQGRNCSQLISR